MATTATERKVARTAYEVNRVYCQAIGDPVPLPWDELPELSQQGYLRAVRQLAENPGMTPEEQHTKWVQTREAQGWRYGPSKKEDLKLHPNLVNYADLSATQQLKDTLFRTVVLNMLV